MTKKAAKNSLSIAAGPEVDGSVLSCAPTRLNPHLPEDYADKLMSQYPETPIDVARPARIELVRPHSFIDDAGRHRMWNQGQAVTDPAEIALLVERKACVKEL